ncbi:MAG: PD-(D/E)XK nuclease-like domain-containing protein [Kofleriaceae bacterium]
MATILDISPDEYHSRPGLSSSTAATLIMRSPLHAWTQHPAYGGAGRKPTELMDRGTAIHSMVLGVGKQIAPLPFDDWRTKAAKESRDKARAAGMIPMLHEDHADAEVAAREIRTRLAERNISLTGESEIAVEWHEDSPSGPVLCRGMMDHLWLRDGIVLDLKVVSSAAPASVERSAENFGYAIQAAAYTRAIAQLRPNLTGRIEFLFAFCEAEPPFAMNICRPDGAFRELGERRWMRAVHEWGACLASGEWPAYGKGINQLSPPAWALAREEFAA